MVEPPTMAGSGQPDLASGPDDAVVLSWLEPDADDEVVLRESTLHDGAWSEPRTVVRGSDVFINWADVPSVVPITSNAWVAHWPKLKPESFGAYDVAFATSPDAGASWTAPILLNDDDTETEHGFATLFAWGDAVGAVWLDGRQLAAWSFDAPDALLGTELRFAKVTRSGEVLETGVIDALVCDCCQTDVALTSVGPLVIYRDRSEDDIRDVVVRAHDGKEWQAPIALGAEGWHIEGCPVNGPAITARDDAVAAAWFTAANDVPRVRFARSRDGGRSFEPALDVDTVGAFGQVDVVLLEDSTAVVTWWRRAEGNRTALAFRTVSREGALGPITTIAENAVPQPLDVPEAVATGDGLLVTWTDGADERVRAALVRNLHSSRD
ncbi:MAG TPA: sialidase family protein [Gammaproteobacteria bacterium]